MPRYSYTARTAGGETVSATVEAVCLSDLAARLAAEGASVRTARELGKQSPRIRGVPYSEIISCYRQMAASMEAGLPLAETLGMLSSESRNSQLRSLLYFLHSRVSAGEPLSEAMAQFPEAFPEVHIAVVRAGEESGLLERSLSDLADQAEATHNMSRRFASSLVYPTVIALAALVLFNFVLVYIVPKFSMLYDDLGMREFPTITRLVFFIATCILPVTGLILVGLVIAISVVATQRKAASGKLWVDAWKLRLPLVGQIVEKAALARFAGMLGLLLESGIDVPRAVRLASQGTGNRTVEQLLRNAAAEVEMGHTLSESLERSSTMPPGIIWRISAGEETGSLPDALRRTSRLYAGHVDSLVTALAGLLEPAFIIAVGIGIAMLVLGMFLPLIALIQNLTYG